MGTTANYHYEQARDWPRKDDGSAVLPGDDVKLPGVGAAVHVVSVAFGETPGGAYVNGFWAGRDERAGVV